MSPTHTVLLSILVGAAVGCGDGYPYCNDESILVPASSLDTADWPEGWPTAWDSIVAAQGTWLASARDTDEGEEPVGDIYVRLQVNEDSLVLLPPDSHMECQEQDAEGTIEVTWPDGSSDVYPAQVDIYLTELPEHDGVFGEYTVTEDVQSIGLVLYGDGEISGTLRWPQSGTAFIEAGPDDRIAE